MNSKYRGAPALIYVLSLCLIATLSVRSRAATYYVTTAGNDANSCSTATSQSTARRSINAGKDCLTTPGDTLIVGDGTYVESAINLTVSGTNSAPITIRAQNALKAILSSTSSSACGPNISFSASYLVVDGIRGQIDPSDPSGCVNNSANGAFVRMWGTNTPQLGGNTSTGYVGGVVRNCQVDASPHRSVGIKTNQDNSLVENCTMHSSLEAFNGINQVFRNNTIDTPDAWGSYFTSKGGARNTQFYNNVITMTSGWEGLSLGGNTGCAGCWWDGTTDIEGYNEIAYNNVVIVNSGTGAWAMGFTGCQNCALYNNVLVNGSLAMQQGGSAGFVQPWPNGSIVKNNIVYCGSANAATSSWGNGVNTTLNYDNFYNCTGAPAQTNTVAGNPLFVNPLSDWHLQAGSPAIGSGTPLTFTGYNGETIDVSKDFSGVTRTVPWDLGIYKSGSTTSTPLSVTMNVGCAPNCPLNGTTTPVTVTVLSGTPAGMSFSRDGLPVFLTCPGGSQCYPAPNWGFDWCITSSCWGGVTGQHTLYVTATDAGGQTATASVTVNVSSSVLNVPAKPLGLALQ